MMDYTTERILEKIDDIHERLQNIKEQFSDVIKDEEVAIQTRSSKKVNKNIL